jgi:hypothetical protein
MLGDSFGESSLCERLADLVWPSIPKLTERLLRERKRTRARFFLIPILILILFPIPILVHIRREDSRGFARIGELGSGRMINLLMFQPVSQFKITRSINIVANKTLLPLQFAEPLLDQLRSIIVVWIKKAREHSRGCASLSVIIDNRPELYEKQTSVSREIPDCFRLRKLRLN